MPPEFTPFSSALGGALIGLSASALLLIQGRVAGISGIIGGLFTPRAGDIGWRVAFVVGLVVAGIAAALFTPELVAVEVDRAPWMVGVAGVLVGLGTRIGNGCTSGHGVCGIGRLSPRGIVATLSFIATGAAAVVAVRTLVGAA